MKRFSLCSPSTKEKVVITVDDCDAYLLRSEVWAYTPGKGCSGGITKSLCGNTRIGLGQQLLGIKDGRLQVAHHKNGDWTDFRRENLIVTTRAEHLDIIRQRRESGKCLKGHDLTLPGGMYEDGGCRVCHRHSAKMAKLKRSHTASLLNDILL